MLGITRFGLAKMKESVLMLASVSRMSIFFFLFTLLCFKIPNLCRFAYSLEKNTLSHSTCLGTAKIFLTFLTY